MDGLTLVEAVESELKKRKISKAKFYEETGISSATFSQWRKQIYAPSNAALQKIEEYLGISFVIEQKESPTGETGEAKKLLTRDKYRDFLKELSMDDLIALNADIADEMRGRGNK